METVIQISEKSCRICLCTCKDIDLDVIQFTSMYYNSTGYQIVDSDIPKKICLGCTKELINTWNFRGKCEKTEGFLMNLVDQLVENVDEESIEEVSKEMVEEELELQVPTEVEENPENDVDLRTETVENTEYDAEYLVDVNYDLINESFQDDAGSSIESLPECSDTEEYERPFKISCDFCDFSIPHMSKIMYLTKHITKSHKISDALIKCDDCGSKFLAKGLLDLHKLGKNCRKSEAVCVVKDCFSCTFCGVRFTIEENLGSHFLLHHKNQELFTCDICDKKFRSTDQLRRHSSILGDCRSVNDGTPIESLQCDFCKFSCSLEANMEYHVKKMHHDKELPQCVCGSQTIFSRSLEDEYYLYRCNEEKSCGEVEEKKEKPTRPKRGRRALHNDGLSSQERKRLKQKQIVQCDICNEEIKRASLLRHISTKHEKVRHVCQHCGQTYSLKENLKTHINKHHLNLMSTYPCKFCGKVFTTWPSRYYHETRVHTKNFKFKCAYCEKQFIHGADLKDHETIHTGEKIRQCDECDEQFTTRDKLKTHKEIYHGKPTPFICEICEKIFTREKNLKKHLKAHEKKQAMSKVRMDTEEDVLTEFIITDTSHFSSN